VCKIEPWQAALRVELAFDVDLSKIESLTYWERIAED
jgi:hypothetical protein